MDVFEKQDIQAELVKQLEKLWVLAKADLEVTDKHGNVLVLDIALHTGDFMYGRITVGSLTRAPLDNVEEIQCTSMEDIDRVVYLAVEMQERHCRSKVVRMVA